MQNESQMIESLKRDYQLFMDGYNSRDRLVNDIFYRLIHVFQFFLIIIIISIGLAQDEYPYHHICCAVIGFAGLLSMTSLLISLEAFSSSKAAIRDQCKMIEVSISRLLPIEEPLKSSTSPHVNNSSRYWQALETREKYLEESYLGGERKSIFRIWASRIIILIWVAIVIALLVGSPGAEALAKIGHLLHLWG